MAKWYTSDYKNIYKRDLPDVRKTCYPDAINYCIYKRIILQSSTRVSRNKIAEKV